MVDLGFLSMSGGRILARLVLLTLFLAGCASPAAQPMPTLPQPPSPGAAPRPVFTATPFHPVTPTAPPRSTPIVTWTPAVFPSVTLLPSPSPIPPNYVFPVQPAHLARYSPGVESHGYPAIDIFAPIGTKFVAVTNGVVEFVSYEDRWQPENDHPALRGGLAVAIVGEDGWRYYGSHLSGIAEGIAPGVTVIAGQVLGYVGESGNARGKTPHVHFGISRPTYAGDWVTRRGEIDPFPYLNAWQSGKDLTPSFP